eukprot:5433758-Pyramimonas_sp.AAC.1
MPHRADPTAHGSLQAKTAEHRQQDPPQRRAHQLGSRLQLTHLKPSQPGAAPEHRDRVPEGMQGGSWMQGQLLRPPEDQPRHCTD